MSDEMGDSAEMIEYFRVRDFFWEMAEEVCTPITPQLGMSKRSHISESIYFEIYDFRILDIKLRPAADDKSNLLKYDYYFSEFPTMGGDLPLLTIDLYGPISDLGLLWSIRTCWLKDASDEGYLDLLLKENQSCGHG